MTEIPQKTSPFLGFCSKLYKVRSYVTLETVLPPLLGVHDAQFYRPVVF